ncbi:hypothetical protein TKK_0007965 [Trichogramma kaykai]|uniref:Endonuclease/exonuclease/phosphatase domain-containing protein n=1 Tax=Trichogramma kaykai TaxID=54128 RepID=A0ABD2X5T5_9HYME
MSPVTTRASNMAEKQQELSIAMQNDKGTPESVKKWASKIDGSIKVIEAQAKRLEASIETADNERRDIAEALSEQATRIKLMAEEYDELWGSLARADTSRVDEILNDKLKGLDAKYVFSVGPDDANKIRDNVRSMIDSIAEFSALLANVVEEAQGKRPLIVAGDFNAWSIEWGSSETKPRGIILLDSSIIDLSFASDSLTPRVAGWRVERGVVTNSDHRVITFNLSDHRPHRGLEGPRWRWSASTLDEEVYSERLSGARIPHAMSERPEDMAGALITAITEACGVFPSPWKRQRLVVLLKPGKPPDAPSSYLRPLCMLDTAGKILERIICGRLEVYTEALAGLSDRQHGFRRGRSTIDAIESFTTAAP